MQLIHLKSYLKTFFWNNEIRNLLFFSFSVNQNSEKGNALETLLPLFSCIHIRITNILSICWGLDFHVCWTYMRSFWWIKLLQGLLTSYAFSKTLDRNITLSLSSQTIHGFFFVSEICLSLICVVEIDIFQKKSMQRLCISIYLLVITKFSLALTSAYLIWV